MIDENNVLVKSFRRVRDFVHTDVYLDFGLRLFRHRFKDPRVYNTPTTDEIATLIVGDMSNMDAGGLRISLQYLVWLRKMHPLIT